MKKSNTFSAKNLENDLQDRFLCLPTISKITCSFVKRFKETTTIRKSFTACSEI